MSALDAAGLAVDLAVLLAKGAVLLLCIPLIDRVVTRLRGGPRHAGLAGGAWVLPCLMALPLLEHLLPSVHAPILVVTHEWLGRPIAEGWSAVTPGHTMLALWASGTVVLLFRLAIAVHRAGNLVRRATPVSDRVLQGTLAAAANAVRHHGPVPHVVESSEVLSPCVFGLTTPVLLVPRWFTASTAEAQFAMLCHELAHVARRDWGRQVLEQMLRAFYWPLPMLARLHRRAIVDRELAADRAVLRAGVSPDAYARLLLSVAHVAHQRPLTSSAAAIGAVAATPEALATLVTFATGRSTVVRDRVQALFSPVARRESPARLAIPLILALTLTVAAVDPLTCLAPSAPPDAVAPRACPDTLPTPPLSCAIK